MPRSIKVLFGQTLRSCELANPSFTELIARIVKLYPSLSGAPFIVRYKDEDDDTISLSSDAEMLEALKCTATFQIVLPKERKDAHTSEDEWQHVAVDASSQPVVETKVEIKAEKTPSARERPTVSAPVDNVEVKHAEKLPPKDTKAESQYVHRGIRCDICNVHPIMGSRFSCTVCPEFDICGSCEAESAHTRTHPLMLHRTPRPAPAQETQVHERIKCDECGVAPITGTRFKCMVCPDYDLCSACDAEQTHPADHPMVKLQVDLKTLPPHLVKAIGPVSDEKKSLDAPVSVHLPPTKTASPRPQTHFVRKGGCFIPVTQQAEELPKKEVVSQPEPAPEPSLRIYVASLGKWVTAVRK